MGTKKRQKDILLTLLLQWQAVVPQKVQFWPLFFCVAWMSVRFPGLKLRPSQALTTQLEIQYEHIA